MNFEGIPKDILECLEKEGISELRPPQVMAIHSGLFESENLMISAPTASGKTLIAEMAVLNNIVNKGGKAVYLCPLRALASEKYEEFQTKYKNIKTVLSIGDFDSRDSYLHEYDLIVTSNEKLDSLLRHGIDWIRKVKVVIVDEVHLINEIERGPTLEVLITRLKLLLPAAQFIYLSATVKNSEELSLWLDAKLVKSDYRPVELKHGTLLKDTLHFNDGKAVKMPDEEPETSILYSTLDMNKQCIYFLSSRRNAESLATKLSNHTKLKSDEKIELEKLSKLILHALESSTEQCEKLSSLVKNGVAFHHAGLVMKQRTVIESAFKKGLIKCICATPTLALGVNLPAFRVVVRDLKRFSNFGMDWISTLEYHQMAGRAGRPAFDKEGQVITISKTEAEMEEIVERFVNGEIEELYSKLSAEDVLRRHVLALITDLFVRTEEDLVKFFKKTFWSFQYSFDEGLNLKLKRVLHELESWGFVKYNNNSYYSTPIGRRISELYIDPLSAHTIIDAFDNMRGSLTNEVSFLHLISTCIEMRPLVSVAPKHYPEISAQLSEYGHYLALEEPNPYDIEYEKYVQSFRTAMMFYEWIGENDYEYLDKKYNIPPGILHNMLLNSEWLLHSIYELAKVYDLKEKLPEISELQLRMKHGVKRELLELISLRGIGRVRARKLFNNKIKGIADVKNADFNVLSAILGQKIAEKVRAQLV